MTLCSLPAQNGFTPLLISTKSRFGYQEAVKLLVERGANVEARDYEVSIAHVRARTHGTDTSNTTKTRQT